MNPCPRDIAQARRLARDWAYEPPAWLINSEWVARVGRGETDIYSDSFVRQRLAQKIAERFSSQGPTR